MLSRCFLDFSVGVGAFFIGLSQISFFFPSSLDWEATVINHMHSNDPKAYENTCCYF